MLISLPVTPQCNQVAEFIVFRVVRDRVYLFGAVLEFEVPRRSSARDEPLGTIGITPAKSNKGRETRGQSFNKAPPFPQHLIPFPSSANTGPFPPSANTGPSSANTGPCRMGSRVSRRRPLLLAVQHTADYAGRGSDGFSSPWHLTSFGT